MSFTSALTPSVSSSDDLRVDLVRRAQIAARDREKRGHARDARGQIRRARVLVRILERDVREERVAEILGVHLRLELMEALLGEAEQREGRGVRDDIVVGLRLRIEMRAIHGREPGCTPQEVRALLRDRARREAVEQRIEMRATTGVRIGPVVQAGLRRRRGRERERRVDELAGQRRKARERAVARLRDERRPPGASSSAAASGSAIRIVFMVQG